jgi:hypothetical protein
MTRFPKYLTLTPEERRKAGIGLPAASSPRTVSAHACTVTMPDGRSGPVAYQRLGATCHRFRYAAPYDQQVFHTGPLERSVEAVERRAADLAPQAFQQAQAEEQKRMRRRTLPRDERSEEQSVAPKIDAKTAERCGGMYAICVRFRSGRLMPAGHVYETPDAARQEIVDGTHGRLRLDGGQQLVVGICNRALRKWQEPAFLAIPDSSQTPQDSRQTEPAMEENDAGSVLGMAPTGDEQNEEVVPMGNRATEYTVCLALGGLPAGAAEDVQAEIRNALQQEVPDAAVTVVSVTEYLQRGEGPWVEEQITPLSVLFCALPSEFQSPATYAALADHYHRELSCLWRSLRDERCAQGVLALRPWRQAGTQWICEFLTYDRGAPAGMSFNFHGQDTSQWQNRETGWAGHQGAIVLDTADGQISSHH